MAGNDVVERDRVTGVPTAGAAVVATGGVRPRHNKAVELATRHSLWLGLIVLAAALSAVSPTFRSPINLQNILSQNAIIGIVACGMLVMMIAGGFDMSVGASGGLVIITTAYLSTTVGLLAAILAGVVLGLAIGVLNGLLVSRLGINSFIATLAMASVIAGVTLVLTNASPVRGDLGPLLDLAYEDVAGVPWLFVIFLAFAILTHVLLTYTKAGHWVYSTGANHQASYLSGIPVHSVRVGAFAFGGVAVSIAAVLLLSQSAVGQPAAATGWPLSAIAICVIGGTSLAGGIGRVSNVIAATLILGVVSNGLNQTGISPYWQPVVSGLVILIAVVVDQLSRRRDRI